jgi:hypothetical protein
VVAALGGQTAPLGDANRAFERNWEANRGAQFFLPRVRATEDSFAVEPNRLMADAARCARINRVYVERLLKLAESRNIKVYWLVPPVSPRVAERHVASGASAKYRVFLDEIRERYPKVVVLDGTQLGLAESDFLDPTHVNGRTALMLSATVAHVMQRGIVGWVDLRAYRENAGPTYYEDYETSQVVARSVRESSRH